MVLPRACRRMSLSAQWDWVFRPILQFRRASAGVRYKPPSDLGADQALQPAALCARTVTDHDEVLSAGT